MPRAGPDRLRAHPRPRRPPAVLRPGVRGGGGGSVCGVARVAAGAGEGGGGPRGTREAAEWTERCNAREMNRAVSKRRSGSGEQTLDALLHLRNGVLLDLLPKGLPLGLFLGRHLQRLDRIEPAEPFGDGFWRRRPLFFCDTECIILCVVDRFLHGFRFLPLRLRAVFPILAIVYSFTFCRHATSSASSSGVISNGSTLSMRASSFAMPSGSLGQSSS